MEAAFDIQGCEFCGRSSPVETMTIHDDCWVCEACDANFREAFAKCHHEWRRHVDQMGDDGQYCARCAGFVRNEDMAALGLSPTRFAEKDYGDFSLWEPANE